MIYHQIDKGSTDQSVTIRIVDSTDGTPETGVTFETSGIDLWYRRDGADAVDITEVTLAALTTAHTDGGFLHIGDGYYRLDLPDAAVATGVNKCVVGGTVTGMVVIGAMIDLTEPFNVTGTGLTAIPWNASWDAEVQSEAADAITAAALATAASLATAQADLDTITGADGVVIASGTQTFDMTGDITGDVSGSVGSVTGAVGSVTGAVGSVTGAVGSVTAAVATTSNIKKNQALASFMFVMRDSTNHAPATGLTVSVFISKDGGAFAATATATATEVANGWYKISFTQTEMNANVIAIRATATASDDFTMTIVTVP